MKKIDHSRESWMVKSTMVLTKAQGRRYDKPSQEQVEKGKSRRKLEDLKDEQALQDYVSEIWEEK